MEFVVFLQAKSFKEAGFGLALSQCRSWRCHGWIVSKQWTDVRRGAAEGVKCNRLQRWDEVESKYRELYGELCTVEVIHR